MMREDGLSRCPADADTPGFYFIFAGRVGCLFVVYMIRAGGGGRGRIDQKMIPHCLVVVFFVGRFFE
jgi:hypothetical protein